MSVGLYVHNSRIKQADMRSFILLLGLVVIGLVEAGLEDFSQLIQNLVVLKILEML